MKLKLPNSKPLPKAEIATAVRGVNMTHAETNAIVDAPQGAETREPVHVMSGEANAEQQRVERKLSRLVEGDFPFDESQLDAIDGLSTEQYACLTGAAGTGKTTVTKAIVDRIIDGSPVAEVDLETYWKSGTLDDPEDTDDRDESERIRWVPAIAMCAFTGRASQQIKKNFPADWHGNIMTIHRMLGYMPEYYEDFDKESGGIVRKRRFVPTYTASNKMPWDVILVDEAGMLDTDLWSKIHDALKPGCRVILVGDINQLPPIYGKSIFGFAMTRWPTWELTKVHRQKGKNNPIVDNAWRVIHGLRPEAEGNFQLIPLSGDANFSSRKVRAILPALQERKLYDPIRDVVITPTNGTDGSRGYALGQLPLNRELALIFNPQSENPRYIIDGGREVKQFAVGDKVMATKNDYETGITNGMTGVITGIHRNESYTGPKGRFGTVAEVNAYAEEDAVDDSFSLSMEELSNTLIAVDDEMTDAKNDRAGRGPSSHTVTVRFGSEEAGFELPFMTLSEVGSLMTAYVVTCHKMQGGEAPTVIIILHDSQKQMLYREWLYTAITRASQRCIVLYTETALRTALNKQTIQGHTLREKVESFNALVGKVSVAMPHSNSTRNLIMDKPREVFAVPKRLESAEIKQGGLAQLIAAQKSKPKVEVEAEVTVRIKSVKVVSEPETIDGGDLTPVDSKPLMIESQPEPKLISQWGAYQELCRQEDSHKVKLLPAPVAVSVDSGPAVVKRTFKLRIGK